MENSKAYPSPPILVRRTSLVRQQRCVSREPTLRSTVNVTPLPPPRQSVVMRGDATLLTAIP